MLPVYWRLLIACADPAEDAPKERDTSIPADEDTGCLEVERYRDADGDGWGAGSAERVCEDEPGYADQDGDCDDADAAVNPAATEDCATSVDDDCDGVSECEPSGGFVPTITVQQWANPLVSVGDVTGDGLSDVVALSSDMRVFGEDLTGWTSGPAAWADGVRYVSSGPVDLDQDGASDLVYARSGNEHVSMYLGPLSGDASGWTPWATRDGGWSGYGGEPFADGDLDSSGMNDLVVLNPVYGDGVISIEYDPSAGRDDLLNADAVLLLPQEGQTNARILTRSDFTGDGLDDLVVGAYSMGDGEIGVFADRLRDESRWEDASLQVVATDGWHLGIALDASDVDGDGYEDLVAAMSGEIVILSGPLSGPRLEVSPTDAALRSVPLAGSDTMSAVGDVDADGYPDIAVAGGYSARMKDLLLVFAGPFEGVRSTQDATYSYSTPDDTGLYEISWSRVTGPGDLDGDLIDDIVLACEDRLMVFLGGW